MKKVLFYLSFFVWFSLDAGSSSSTVLTQTPNSHEERELKRLDGLATLTDARTKIAQKKFNSANEKSLRSLKCFNRLPRIITPKYQQHRPSPITIPDFSPAIRSRLYACKFSNLNADMQEIRLKKQAVNLARFIHSYKHGQQTTAADGDAFLNDPACVFRPIDPCQATQPVVPRKPLASIENTSTAIASDSALPASNRRIIKPIIRGANRPITLELF